MAKREIKAKKIHGDQKLIESHFVVFQKITAISTNAFHLPTRSTFT